MSITDIAACAEIGQTPRRTAGRRQHLRHARADAAVGAGARTSSCTRRPSTWAGTATCWAARWWSRIRTLRPAVLRAERHRRRDGAFESFLFARGLKTLELRVREQCRTAQRLAELLAGDPRVRRVLYPGLPSHPGHEIAARQMDGGSARCSVSRSAATSPRRNAWSKSTKLFQLAVSLGAVESLIEQPASMSHASYDRADRAAHGITDGLIRLSVGLEDFEDLREDLDQALEA